jgi:hypothetical protein
MLRQPILNTVGMKQVSAGQPGDCVINLDAVQTNAAFSIARIAQIVGGDCNLWQLAKSVGGSGRDSSGLLRLRVHGLMGKCLRLLVLLLKGIAEVWRKEILKE